MSGNTFRQKPSKKQTQKKYAFRGLFSCGECGCAITAETQKGHNYYRCTKKKAPCTQKYIREELLAESISIEVQKVSLNEATKNRMLEELLKEQQTEEVASGPFAQKLREQIAELEKKLDFLLDERLNKTITTEEYTTKKQKILNQKIENEQKLSVFERKGNRWLEPLQNFIIAAHQAQITAELGNFSEKKNFLKRIGSNPLLCNRQIVLMAKKPWGLLAETNDVAEGEPRSGEGATSKKEIFSNWLGW